MIGEKIQKKQAVVDLSDSDDLPLTICHLNIL